jgi:hypothetical protein
VFASSRSSVLRSSFSGSSGLFKQAKGWRYFTIADGVFVRRVGTVPSDLPAAEPDEREKGTLAPSEQKPMGPAEKDRPIDPMSGRNTSA